MSSWNYWRTQKYIIECTRDRSWWRWYYGRVL